VGQGEGNRYGAAPQTATLQGENMGFLTVVLWAIVAVPVLGIVLWLVGGFLHASDKVKAARYLGEQYDKEHRG